VRHGGGQPRRQSQGGVQIVRREQVNERSKTSGYYHPWMISV
jgi:hypothetical protein